MIDDPPSAVQFGNVILEHSSRDVRGERYLLRRRQLAGIVREFHSEIGMLTSAVEHYIEMLAKGAQIVRVAHQPNVFIYINVIAHAFYVHHVAAYLTGEGLPAVPAYFVVDYDASSDRRFRRAALPDPLNRDGQCSLSLGIDNSQKASVPWKLHLNPSDIPNWERRWERYCHSIQTHVRDVEARSVMSSAMNISKLIPHNLDRAPLSNYLTAIIAQYLIINVGVPVLFFPLHRTVQLFEPELSSIMRQMIEGNMLERMPDGLVRLPLWYVCPECGGRNTICTDNRRHVEFGCRLCGTNFTADFLSFLRAPIATLQGQLAPMVLTDYILDYVGYTIAGGSCYASGRAALAAAREACITLAISAPPDTTWRLSPFYAGPAEMLAFELASRSRKNIESILKAVGIAISGRCSVAYFGGLPKFGVPCISTLNTMLRSESPGRPMTLRVPVDVSSMAHQDEVIEFLQEASRTLTRS